MSTGRLITTVKPTYRVSYALIRYISARPYAKTVSNRIGTKTETNRVKNVLRTVIEKIKDFFYS